MKIIELFAFDLDGTLLDTAPDFLYAVNILREKYKLDEADFNQVRSRVSQGAASLASYALNLDGDSQEKIELHRHELLDIYENCCLINTEMFDGIEEVLSELNNKQIKWGIVTNKHSKFVKKILKGLQIDTEINCLITGDMVNEPKPNPEGLLEACKIIGVDSSECIYVGDDERDIMAGKSAGMLTIAADFGFIHKDHATELWQADKIIKNPSELINFL